MLSGNKNTFAAALKAPQPKLTANGDPAYDKTGNAVLDLFYQGPVLRGEKEKVTSLFIKAYNEDSEMALRCALYIRDPRQGQGERDTFRTILNALEDIEERDADRLLIKVPELGRWDDILHVKSQNLKNRAARMIQTALKAKDRLCAKWMPRKGPDAIFLRNFLELSPKAYRKLLVENTDVVETKMCAQQWKKIEYAHVPSRAMFIYKKAYKRHDGERFNEHIQKAINSPNETKVNASVMYPHELLSHDLTMTKENRAQWEHLPNWTGEATVLPMVDVSGSMALPAGPNSKVTCMQVAVGLGLYLADKQKNAFKNTFLTFSSDTELQLLVGDIQQKINQLEKSNWGMSTDVYRAAKQIVDFGKRNNVPDKNMPRILLILSDMQFNDGGVVTGISRFKKTFLNAGYTPPTIVYWNLSGRYNTAPVTADEKGVALISGFSPAIIENLCKGDLEGLSPRALMLKKLLQPRYDV